MSLRDGGAVLGPNDDPHGWKVLPPVSVKGYVDGNSQLSEVEITVSIILHIPATQTHVTSRF